MSRITEYGFEWGPIEVLRACSDNRYHTIIVRSKNWETQISVSPSGRAMHINKAQRRSEGSNASTKNPSG